MPVRTGGRPPGDLCTPMFIAEFFTEANRGDDLKVHGHRNGSRKCGLYTHTGIPLSLKQKEILPRAAAGRSLKDITLQ